MGGNVDIQLDMAEESRQRHGEIAIGAKRNMTVAGVEALERNDPLT